MYNSEEDIFSLTDDLSSSYVDPDNLISSYQNKFPIGMDNFRTAKKQPNQENPLFKNSAFNRNHSPSPQILARQRWKSAALKVKLIKDPWADFKLDLYPTETCVRHRYNAIKKQWVTDECMVKLEPKQFANGAMRACFRMKKLSKMVHTESWEHASNYVAKSYMLQEEFTRDDYFNDVKLQMDAKLWAEIFNRHNPPKKIDMFQVSVLEFPDGRLFHLEHFIDGKYIKYNSNSGFVEDVHIRNTPQAFSHFTFESSGHELIVVDVQGVGDLYTDPQIHTSHGTEYGEGNLGIKGIALFFSNHICNDVCRSLGLSQFDLAKQELISNTQVLNHVQKSCLTTFRQSSEGSDSFLGTSPANNITPFYDSFSRVRQRVFSETSMCSENSNSGDLPDISESEGYESSSPISPKSQSGNPISVARSINIPSIPIAMSPMVAALRCQGRVRTESHCLDSAFSMDEAFNYFNSKKRVLKLRSSSVAANTTTSKQQRDDNELEEASDYSFSYTSNSNDMEDEEDEEEEESVLGRVHLELAKYHVMGRFCKDIYEDFDQQVAFYHLEQAAKLGVIEAMSNVAKIYLQLPNDILPEYEVEESELNRKAGFEFILGSADKGEKSAMLIVAKMLDCGVGLGKNMSQDWLKSVEYYQRVVNASSDEDLDDSIYLVLARMAEMNLKGGFGLDTDPSEAYSLYNEAAEKAMAFGKGRLANKYYELAEEASAACDENEDGF